MANLTGKGLVDHCKSKLGTPYVYGAKGANGAFTQSKLDSLSKSYPSIFTDAYIIKAKKFIGQVCTDCSGLISWYTGKVYGSSQLCSNASKKLALSKDMPAGTVVWRSGHVGVYDGKGYVYEAKGINYGTIKSEFIASKWTYGLLFDWMSYDSVDVEKPVNSNPYKEPSIVLKKGDTGDGVRWLQYELKEAGFDIKIDGVFGNDTEKAVNEFQMSCKITIDGKVGPTTREALNNDKGVAKNPYTEPTCEISKGDKGDCVKWLQYELCSNGYSVDIDGVFGEDTEAAVIAFQEAHPELKIKRKGVVGKKTVKALVA